MPEKVDTLTQGDPLYVLTTYRSVKWKSAASVVVSEYTHTEIPEMKGQTLLDPQYVVGFVDGEGCFCVSISKHATLKRGYEVRLLFEIEVREDDQDILEMIRKTIGCGTIYRLEYERYKKWRPHVKLKVSNLRDIAGSIIPFFDRYPLQAKKRKSYEIFRTVALMMLQKQHLTDDGFRTIQRLKEKMNP